MSRLSWGAIVAIGVAWWFVAAYSHAAGYFLLADDHALVADAAAHSFRGIFTTGLFGVYRPLGFTVARVLGPLHPGHAGWIAVVLALHATNAGLLFVAARSLGLTRGVAAALATLFLWSPWASEAYLWFSAIFDVGATFGVLLALVLVTAGRARPAPTENGTPATDPTRRRRAAEAGWETLLAFGIVVGCVTAGLFKENGYLAGPLVLALALASSAPHVRRRALIGAGASLVCAVLLYTYRTRVLAGVDTPYTVAGFGGRLLSLDAIAAVASNLRALLLWPVPGVWGDTTRYLAALLIWPIGASAAAALAVRALLQPGRAWYIAAAIPIAIAATAGFQFDVMAIVPRRYLYMAGVSFCLLIGYGIDAWRSHCRWPAAVPTVIGALVLVAALAGTTQARIWGLAAATARCAMEDFGRQVPAPEAVYVENMPFAIEEGPIVLLEYDFSYTYAKSGAARDAVFRRAVLTLANDGTLAVQGHFEPPVMTGPRRTVTLDFCLGRAR